MAFKFAIANRVEVAIKGLLPGATRDTPVKFDFTLDMDRIDQDEVTAAYGSDAAVVDFLLSKTRGWNRQRLVLDESDNPAAFGEEAYRALLKIPGMALYIFQAYIRDLGVREKN